MDAKPALAWFLSVVAAAVGALMAFNAAADCYLLADHNGGSLETLSGFERVLKPVWIDSIEPSLVFIGSSRVREGFDPVLIDPAFHVKTFNYGVSSVTAYEARRFFEDALAHPSVKTIVVGVDAFAGDGEGQKSGPGFDELRLAVTKEGTPTPRRALWQFTTRYLSGGALGMHALGLFMLLQLAHGQTAQDRPDLFRAYDRMTTASRSRDLMRRAERTMQMGSWQREQLGAVLADVCHRDDVRTILFFPPDNAAVMARYVKNDRAGLHAFKEAVVADVQRHNANCPGKVALFDFLNHNAVTDETMTAGRSNYYLDLVHFRPPVGLRLLRRMLGLSKNDANLGTELVSPEGSNAEGRLHIVREMRYLCDRLPIPPSPEPIDAATIDSIAGAAKETAASSKSSPSKRVDAWISVHQCSPHSAKPVGDEIACLDWVHVERVWCAPELFSGAGGGQ